MALFFDQAWFDARLAALALTRAPVAAALGLTEPELAEVWKDQRELRAAQVTVLAGLLGVTPEEVASRAGVSTPVPKAEPTLADLAARIARLEAEMAALKARLT
jgi:transcriptional regulator with XRE-family HTH domain